MAEGLLFYFLGAIAQDLTFEALKEIKLPFDAKNDLRSLTDSFSSIKAVIADAEKQQVTCEDGARREQVKDWVSKLKHAMYDVEDFLDALSTEKLIREAMTRNKKAKRVRIFFSDSNQLMHRLRMAHEIKNLRKRLDDIDRDKNQFGFSASESNPKTTRTLNRETHSYIPREEVIGREMEKGELLQLLMKPDGRNNVSVIAIVGLGGLGKTTLAQRVFEDIEIFSKGHFEPKIWVSVYNDFDVKTIAKKIAGDRSGTSNLEQVQNKLRSKIEGKRYLLILDDVWEENPNRWDELEILLRSGGEGSKIIVTTRSESVANATRASLSMKLKGLDEEKSWMLFRKIAFKNEQVPQDKPEIKRIGKEILKKCVGVPLAIKTIARLLSLEEVSEQSWKSFQNENLIRIHAGQGNNDIGPILQLSYDYLPPNLKKCFAFCSLFPKDSPIYKEKLIKMWMAHGFIHGEGCLEDIGERYFMDLVWRCFFQHIYEDSGGEIICCEMHDLVHDVAESILGDECVRFARGECINERTRHIWKESRLGEWEGMRFKGEKVRTFICHRYGADEEYIAKMISGFKRLRVLECQLDESNTLILNSIVSMKYLRYLDLSNSKIVELPNSITKLLNLQTLKLNYCRMLGQLPQDLSELRNLRHLQLDDCLRLTHMPYGMGLLTCLQELTLFVLSKDDGKQMKSEGHRRSGIHELRGLNNLRGTFCLKGLDALRRNPSQVMLANLSEKPKLQRLELFWLVDSGTTATDRDSIAQDDDIILQGLAPHANNKIRSITIEGFCGSRLPAWFSTLSYLRCLSFSYCKKLPQELRHLTAF